MPLFLIAARLFRGLGRYRVRTLIGVAVAIVVIGAILFSVTQGVSIGIALYWAITTATTVGYGDVLPHDSAGRLIAAGVMLTTIPIVGAVFALIAGAAVLSRLRRLLGMDTRLPLDSYTVVYGSHPVLPRVIGELVASGDPVVVVAATKPSGLSEELPFLAGDPTDEALIARSEPGRANRALIACESDADTLVIAVAIRALAPALEVYALTQSPAVARALKELGVSQTLSIDELVGHTIAKSLETPQAGSVLLAMVDTASYRMVETGVAPEFVAQRLSAARGRAGALVLGVCRSGHVDLGVGADPVLTAEDRLIVLEPA